MAITTLQYLDFMYNKIAVLEHHSFYGLHQLKTLNLHHNHIMEINLGDLPAGVEIYLIFNPISYDGFLGLPYESSELFEFIVKDGQGMPIHVPFCYYNFYYIAVEGLEKIEYVSTTVTNFILDFVGYKYSCFHLYS